MNIGIGLPAAVPGVDATTIGRWAAAAESAGFTSVGVIDRLVYDNLEPLVALAAAASCTERVELLTTVLNVGWRGNPVLLAKQVASVDLLSGGRLTAGLGLGGWPEDHEVSGTASPGAGARFDAAVAAMVPGRPALLFGGMAARSYERAARIGDGWVAPLFGREVLEAGVTAVRRAWAEAARAGEPRIVTGRYVCLGPDADRTADHYIRHYYGDAYVEAARADTATSGPALAGELEAVAAAGATDVVLFPCSSDLDEVRRVADVVFS